MRSRILIILLLFCGFSTIAASAHNREEVIASMVNDLKANHTDEAALTFGEVVKSDANEAELIYWIVVRNFETAIEPFAQKLVKHYRLRGNSEKAAVFYKELLDYRPDNVDYLLGYADAEIQNGNETEAYLACEQIASVDPDNVIAHIFLGNYLYLQAERRKRFLDKGYTDLKSPTSMQYGEYRDQLSQLFKDVYEPARIHLQVAERLFPSAEVKKTLQDIDKVEKEVYR